jgi:acyl carrier protein
MSEMTIRDRLLILINERLKISVDENDLSISLKELGVDTLDLAELLMNIEEEFSIDINDDEVDITEPLHDVLELIQEKTSAPSN